MSRASEHAGAPAAACPPAVGRLARARDTPLRGLALRGTRPLCGPDGFSLIELLVVILIIGVLAGIAIPLFLSQKSKATDAQAKELAHSAQTAIAAYAADNGGSFEGASVEKLESIEPSLKSAGSGDEASLSTTEWSATTYKLTVTAASGDTFTLSRSSGGEVSRTCKQASGSQGCPTGSW